MAQRTVIQLTDDLDGKPIPDRAGETVRFSLDHHDYEIDLADKNAEAMREAVEKYVSAARRTSRSTRSANSSAGRSGGGTRNGSNGSAAPRDYDPKAIRAWAHAHGIEVSERGRVPADLIVKFRAGTS